MMTTLKRLDTNLAWRERGESFGYLDNGKQKLEESFYLSIF